MTLAERIDAFSELGNKLRKLSNSDSDLDNIVDKAGNENRWFTPQSIAQAIEGITFLLDTDKLHNWVKNYNVSQTPNQVGIVMAGNIPLVGFHDFLCVILAGHTAVIKPSSQDMVLIKTIIEMLVKIDPRLSERIIIAEKLNNVDAVIATGSDNTSRYFKKYFQNIPHIIRKNRTSVAVLSGLESENELQLLGHDIFSFFGLGCRNVAKIYLPIGYDMKILLKAQEGHREVINHPKYFNNYEYNKAIYLINGVDHLDTGFALFTQNTDTVSPLAVIYYEEYADLLHLYDTLKLNADKIQCIVSNSKLASLPTVSFGQAQQPDIDDYADNVDTMAFLCKL